MAGIVSQCIRDGVEEEKCVVDQFVTTKEQKEAFKTLLRTNSKDRIPLEWIIDIADEQNGWFYATAYHYNDSTNMLHVMVPDRENPTFDGEVLLDYRTVHVVECVDGKTDALFNKIVRDSVIKVKWTVEWLDEDSSPLTSPTKNNDDEGSIPVVGVGRWIPSVARYYFRLANQLLVEDEDFGENDARGFVMLTADMNVRLISCQKSKGQEDFDRLVVDGVVLSSPEVLEAAKRSLNENNLMLAAASTPDQKKSGGGGGGGVVSPGEGGAPNVKKLAEMSRVLKECVSDLLDEREKTMTNRLKMAKTFRAFLDGDLDAGLQLMTDSDDVELKHGDGRAEEKDLAEINADESWLLVQKVEKHSLKLLKATGGDSSASLDEVNALRKMQRNMRKELEDKEKELQALRARAKLS